MEEKISLGKFITTRRRFLRLTQEEMAKRIGVSKSAVAKWEGDGGVPDTDNLKVSQKGWSPVTGSGVNFSPYGGVLCYLLF